MFARDVFEEELSQAAWKTVCSAAPTKRRMPSRPPCWKAALENYRYLSLEIKTLAAARREWPHDNWMIYQITTNYVKIPVEPAHVLLRCRFFFSFFFLSGSAAAAAERRLLSSLLPECERPSQNRRTGTSGSGLVVKTISSRLKGPR